MINDIWWLMKNLMTSLYYIIWRLLDWKSKVFILMGKLYNFFDRSNFIHVHVYWLLTTFWVDCATIVERIAGPVEGSMRRMTYALNIELAVVIKLTMLAERIKTTLLICMLILKCCQEKILLYLFFFFSFLQ